MPTTTPGKPQKSAIFISLLQEVGRQQLSVAQRDAE
jgi:hypothetical protein